VIGRFRVHFQQFGDDAVAVQEFSVISLPVPAVRSANSMWAETVHLRASSSSSSR